MPASARLRALLRDLDLDLDAERAQIAGADPVLASRYPLGESAAAVLAATGLAAGRLWELRGGAAQRVGVDVRHAGALLRGFLDQVVDGEVLDPDPTSRLPAVGLFRAGDGRWVALHGAFEPLRERTLSVLGSVANVARWDAEALVEALTAAGAPGAVVRDADAWAAHPQGRALAALPLVSVERIGDAPPMPLPAGAPSPLDGVRVLDLTRILAGPTCGRTLAEHGADVLHLSAPRLHTVHRAHLDTAVGKRTATLDLDTAAGRSRLDALLDDTDVLSQNARPGSFERRGLGAEAVAARRPGIVYVSTDTYGHVGPWRERPGFEPMAQASTGWALDHADADGAPRLVGALPCDYLTGYLAALGTLVALTRRATVGGSWHVRTSLCRTAMWLRAQEGRHDPSAAAALDPFATRDLRVTLRSELGVVSQLRPGVRMSLTPPVITGGARRPGADAPAFAGGGARG